MVSRGHSFLVLLNRKHSFGFAANKGASQVSYQSLEMRRDATKLHHFLCTYPSISLKRNRVSSPLPNRSPLARVYLITLVGKTLPMLSRRNCVGCLVLDDGYNSFAGLYCEIAGGILWLASVERRSLASVASRRSALSPSK